MLTNTYTVTVKT